jgi:hypothetical protein
MNLQIRPGSDHDVEELVRLSLLAWALFSIRFGRSWGLQSIQSSIPTGKGSKLRRSKCFVKSVRTPWSWWQNWRAIWVGFLVYELNHKDKTGEVQLLAVHSDAGGTCEYDA